MPKNWSDDEVYTLLAEVEYRPGLWKKHDSGFKLSLNEKDSIWNDVAAIVGRDVKEVKAKWQGLKYSLQRSRKARERGHISDASTWRFYGAMHFYFEQAEREHRIEQQNAKRRQNQKEMSRSWTDEEIERLINEVRPRDKLWKLEDDENFFVSNKSRKILWDEIASIMNIPARELILKWKGLKFQFSRERRTMAERASEGRLGQCANSWRFYRQLHFAQDYISDKKLHQNSDYDDISQFASAIGVEFLQQDQQKQLGSYSALADSHKQQMSSAATCTPILNPNEFWSFKPGHFANTATSIGAHTFSNYSAPTGLLTGAATGSSSTGSGRKRRSTGTRGAKRGRRGSLPHRHRECDIIGKRIASMLGKVDEQFIDVAAQEITDIACKYIKMTFPGKNIGTEQAPALVQQTT